MRWLGRGGGRRYQRGEGRRWFEGGGKEEDTTASKTSEACTETSSIQGRCLDQHHSTAYGSLCLFYLWRTPTDAFLVNSISAGLSFRTKSEAFFSLNHHNEENLFLFSAWRVLFVPRDTFQIWIIELPQLIPYLAHLKVQQKQWNMPVLFGSGLAAFKLWKPEGVSFSCWRLNYVPEWIVRKSRSMHCKRGAMYRPSVWTVR